MKASRTRSPSLDGGAEVRWRAERRAKSSPGGVRRERPAPRRRVSRPAGAIGWPMWVGTAWVRPGRQGPGDRHASRSRATWCSSWCCSWVSRPRRRRSTRRERPIMRAALSFGTNRQPSSDGLAVLRSRDQFRTLTALPRRRVGSRRRRLLTAPEDTERRAAPEKRMSPAACLTAPPATVCPSSGLGRSGGSTVDGKHRPGGMRLGRRRLRA